jgi:hypothetical protein
VNSGLEMMCKEMFVILLKALLCICLEGLRQSTRIFSQESRYCSRGFLNLLLISAVVLIVTPCRLPHYVTCYIMVFVLFLFYFDSGPFV